jgi:serine O-acetyltransferase
MLASFFHSTILNHRDLRSALSFQLANKLDSTTMPAIALREVIELALRSEPELLAAVAADICAVQDRDPAVDLFSTPLLYLKGFHALQGYRVANWLWRQGRRALALYLQNQISVVFGVDVHPAARIGKGIMFDHATGIVVGETAVIENDVSILQSVTLGGPARRVAIVTPKSGKG